jgi:hypothetical protein
MELVAASRRCGNSGCFSVAIPKSKAHANLIKIEFREISCKPSFWLAGQFRPPWVPVAPLQLLVDFPVPTGSSSGDSVLLFFLLGALISLFSLLQI